VPTELFAEPAPSQQNMTYGRCRSLFVRVVHDVQHEPS
jgi:hypothetical protein